ncbi:MAG: hypothetical protein GX558_06430, partial [Clostridiales bacterium]|nr:hypothetical protein [Clostridiales bacterium]
MKRMLVAFTVLLLLVGLAAGASAEQPSWMQPYDEPITITFGRTGTTSSPRFPDGEAIDDN